MLPQSIRVGPMVYEVVEDPVSRNHQNRGEHDSSHVRVNIAPDMSVQRKRVTLAHEVIHAIFDTQGRNRGGKFTEEEVCDLLAPAIVELLRDNPGLIDYLRVQGP